MAYGIRETRRQLRAMNGDLVLIGKRRHVPPNGRGYWLNIYRVELPGRKLHQIDEHHARMASEPAVLQELIQSMTQEEA